MNAMDTDSFNKYVHGITSGDLLAFIFVSCGDELISSETIFLCVDVKRRIMSCLWICAWVLGYRWELSCSGRFQAALPSSYTLETFLFICIANSKYQRVHRTFTEYRESLLHLIGLHGCVCVTKQ